MKAPSAHVSSAPLPDRVRPPATCRGVEGGCVLSLELHQVMFLAEGACDAGNYVGGRGEGPSCPPPVVVAEHSDVVSLEWRDLFTYAEMVLKGPVSQLRYASGV